jgi:two-component system phosphate regulon response regulator PhoB
MPVTKTILIVDDCKDIALIIARYLASVGYRTVTAANGIEAQRFLAVTTPDCILLDLMMPDMSGTELLHCLRNDPSLRTIPVVLVSARVGTYGTHCRSAADADYSVGKPFTKVQIVNAVRTVLAKKAAAQDAPAASKIPAPPPDGRPAAGAHVLPSGP